MEVIVNVRNNLADTYSLLRMRISLRAQADLPRKYAALGRRRSGEANDKVKRTVSFAIINEPEP